MNFRIEKDSIGEVQIPENALWGPQTQRSLENFKIGSELMPWEIIESLIIIKRAAAIVNGALEVVDEEISKNIIKACDDILSGDYRDFFPLVVWQTGSGTQTNMNVNEVVANIANKRSGLGSIHPNDHVNKSQSTNDVFPSAINMALVKSCFSEFIPKLKVLIDAFELLAAENRDIIKIGRTHMQDAVPVRLAQEFYSYANVLKIDYNFILNAIEEMRVLAIGGTAVGTGLNTPGSYDFLMAEELSDYTGLEFYASQDKFVKLAFKNDCAALSSALKNTALDLIKIGNDIRLLASGPRCGIGELQLPENEPGSSIMPGKVNPTQIEALTMVCARVLGNDTSISFAASQGNLQLNAYMPLIGADLLNSVKLLGDAIQSFRINCVEGIKPRKKVIESYLENSLMLVTALSPHIGYEKCAEIAKFAHEENSSLKEAALKLGYLSAAEFDKYLNVEDMLNE